MSFGILWTPFQGRSLGGLGRSSDAWEEPRERGAEQGLNLSAVILPSMVLSALRPSPAVPRLTVYCRLKIKKVTIVNVTLEALSPQN